jgi:CHAT domain-containing protein
LVTLSACQSGLGTPVSGEHLLGLRRSLHIAGARTTLTSLWRVDDAATAALMADFYRALWRFGLPPAAALRRVQLAAIASQRAAGEVLPGTWGAFVVEGR